MNRSKILGALSYLALISMVLIGYSCAASKSAIYFDQNSINNNDEYFKAVSDHFNKIGNLKTLEEIKQYTAAVFIASLPPVVEVYEENELMGKTNIELLYFKPGDHTLLFKSSEGSWKEEITLQSGRNRSIMVKK